MTCPVDEIKIRAELLHRRIRAGEARPLSRLRKLPEFRRASDSELASAAGEVKRRHCLGVVAAEFGFEGWPQAKRALAGESGVEDFGALLYPSRCCGHLSLWYRSHAEAAAVRESRGGYLLAYCRQFFVVDRHFVDSLGLDPDDGDWDRIGFDWARPHDVAARTRLYEAARRPAARGCLDGSVRLAVARSRALARPARL